MTPVDQRLLNQRPNERRELTVPARLQAIAADLAGLRALVVGGEDMLSEHISLLGAYVTRARPDVDWFPYPDGTFDVVVIDRVRRARVRCLLPELKRVLVPGGKLVTYVWLGFSRPRWLSFTRPRP